MIGIMDWLDALPSLQRAAVALLIASVLCMGATWATVLCLRNRSAAFRGQIWLAGFLAIVVLAAAPQSGVSLRLAVLRAPSTPPPALVPKPDRTVMSASLPLLATEPASPEEQAPPVPRAPHRDPVLATPWDIGSLLAGAWLLVIGVGLVRMLAGLAGLRACVRSSVLPVRDGRVARLAAELGLNGARVRLYDGVHSPISFGWFRTWVILPLPAEDWTDDRLRIVLRHEQAHGDRRDFLTTFLIRVIAILCWPNPLVWLGVRRFRSLCEDATDDRATMGGNATAYADELFQLLRELRLPPKKYGLALSMAHGSSTRARIARLLDEWIDRAAPSRRQSTLILATALTLAVFGGALRLVQAEAPASASSSSKEGAWMEKIKSLQVETPTPKDPPKPGDFKSVPAYRKASEKIWGDFWAKEHPRLWKLAQTEEEFLQHFPDSPQAPTIRKEMIESILRCLEAKGPVGKEATGWIKTTLARPDLTAATALPIYSYQANMIGILSNDGNIDWLVPVPKSRPDDIPESIDELTGQFAKRFPGTPELGSLYINASFYVEDHDQTMALRFVDRALSLVKDSAERTKIEGAQFRLTAVGKPAPSLDFTALDGRKVNLAALKGEVVLIDFWATWCPPCVEKVPELKAIAARWKDLQIIGVDLDTDRHALETFLKKNELSWPQYFDGLGWENKIAAEFGVQSIPSAWVIDRQGKVAAVAPESLAMVLEKLLGPGTLPKSPALANEASLKIRQTSKGSMTVHVVDTDGKPIAGAEVQHSVWTDEPFKANATYKTDVKGNVSFKLPHTMRILRLWVSKEAMVPLFADWEVTPGNNVTFPDQATFVLQKGTRIGGTIVDEKGHPIAGAKVEVALMTDSQDVSGKATPNEWLAYGSDARVTDAKGHWSIDNAPSDPEAEFRIKTSHPDFINDSRWGGYQKEQQVTTEQLRAQTARIAMPRGVSLSGQVTDPAGKPIDNAVVIRGNDPYSEEGSQEVVTDASGHYRLPPLLPGPLTLTVATPGWAPQQKEVTLAADPAPADFRLEQGKTLHIQFVDQSGKPVPEVEVSLETWRHNRALYNMRHPNVVNTRIPDRADKNGVYEWTWAPADEVKFTFQKDGYQPLKNQMLAPGEHRIELAR